MIGAPCRLWHIQRLYHLRRLPITLLYLKGIYARLYYIRLWIHRHRHWLVDRLIATLVEAVDVALDRNRDIVLPEWPAEPAADQAGDPPLEASSA
jgi:hypothetical protein